MKLVIQVPAFNEAGTLGATLADLPRSVDGFDVVEVLVIDDGSSDGTAAEARRAGADHVRRHTQNLGLARAFSTGLSTALELGADVVVNTDADNQYDARDIARLTAPILAGDADLVIGARPIDEIREFSFAKKVLQRVGSSIVGRIASAPVTDAPSGFRAMSRRAAQQLNVFSQYTYTLETIIQAGKKGLKVVSVPIGTNASTRPSRLVRSVGDYIRRSTLTMGRILMVYRPFKFFAIPGALAFLAGTALGIRFLYFQYIGEGDGHVQSVILSALLLGVGSTLVIVGLVADLVAINRQLLEKLESRIWTLHDRLLRDEPEAETDPGPEPARARSARNR